MRGEMGWHPWTFVHRHHFSEAISYRGGEFLNGRERIHLHACRRWHSATLATMRTPPLEPIAHFMLGLVKCSALPRMAKGWRQRDSVLHILLLHTAEIRLPFESYKTRHRRQERMVSRNSGPVQARLASSCSGTRCTAGPKGSCLLREGNRWVALFRVLES